MAHIIGNSLTLFEGKLRNGGARCHLAVEYVVHQELRENLLIEVAMLP